MKFIFKIQCDNAAFKSEDGSNDAAATDAEVARLLRLAADRVEQGGDQPVLLDFNGNTVGRFEFINEWAHDDASVRSGTRLACPHCKSSEGLTTLDTLEAKCLIAGISRAEDGTFLLAYTGSSDMLWDTQMWGDRDGRMLLICNDCGEIDIKAEDLIPAVRYVATINVPGYLPMDDDPPVFDDPREAWEYLADERKRGEDDTEDPGGYSATANTLETLGTGMHHGTESDFQNAGLDPIERTGTIYGPTPGYEGDHDLGLAYTVQIAEDEES